MKVSFCFLALNAYPLIKITSEKFIGGAELQQILIGSELARRGYSVSYITLDHGQGVCSREGLFEVFSTFKPHEGIPGLRFFYPRLLKLWQALNRTNADVYYIRCAGFLLGVLVLWARLNKKKVIFCGAADSDFDSQNPMIKHCRDKIIYFWGLKRCATIVVQNSLQKNILKKNFQRNGVVIHNGMKKYRGMSSFRDSILWVGSIRSIKDPKTFLDLAIRFPASKFVMVGGKFGGQEDLYESIARESKRLPNLKFRGLLSLEETEKEFDQAKLFLNTSLQEGFPNTFLQAWRQGIPVISFVDPDGLIAKHSLGKNAANKEDMIKEMEKFLSQENRFDSEAIKNFFNENLVIEKQVDEYEKLFKLLVNNEY